MSVLVHRGVPFKRSQSKNTELILRCMFCPDAGLDARFTLCVNIVNGAGICHHCNWRSRHATYYILRHAGVLTEIDGGYEEETPTPAAPTLPKDFICLSRVFDDLDKAALAYVLGRGITVRQIKSNRIGVSFSGRTAYRIVFPVWHNKLLSGFVARDFTEKQTPKYLNSPGQKSLYNLPQHSPDVVLSEGIFKALRIAQVVPAHISSSTTLGRSITDIQLEQLRECACESVTVWPDPDEPGIKGAVDIADRLTDAGFAASVVWQSKGAHSIYADEADAASISGFWKMRQPFCWTLRQKMLLSTND